MSDLRNFEEIGQDLKGMAHGVRGTVEDRVENAKGHEGAFTRRIERYTSALPSTTWLTLAAGAIAGSLALKIMGRDKTANFVGEWAPTFLLLGIYNKLVKLHGSERER